MEIQPRMADMGWKLPITVHSDATAAIGIARRKNLGKIRHLDVTDLWIQEGEVHTGGTQKGSRDRQPRRCLYQVCRALHSPESYIDYEYGTDGWATGLCAGSHGRIMIANNAAPKCSPLA